MLDIIVYTLYSRKELIIIIVVARYSENSGVVILGRVF